MSLFQLAEMVNLHFLSLMEALQECNSSVLAKVDNFSLQLSHFVNKMYIGFSSPEHEVLVVTYCDW